MDINNPTEVFTDIMDQEIEKLKRISFIDRRIEKGKQDAKYLNEMYLISLSIGVY